MQFRSWKLAPGFVTFKTYTTGGGIAVSVLTSDPSFPNSPRETFYINSFNTRLAYPDDTHEGYGGWLSGVFIPPTTGNWLFYLNADNGSELSLNPTGNTPSGKILLLSAADSTTFAAAASAPQALTAGQPYYIEALYKENTGGDYCRVAAKLDTDPTEPGALLPLTGDKLGTYLAPGGYGLAITVQPATQQATRSSASQFLGLETFNAGNARFSVNNGIEGANATLPAESWLYRPAEGVWNVSGSEGVKNSALSSPAYLVKTGGQLNLTFEHRYHFEKDTVNWDGGVVRVSKNGGPYVYVNTTNIVGENYALDRLIGGNSPPLNGRYAFNGISAGFATSNYVTSTANLGSFVPGDLVSIQFLGAWDEGFAETPPGWEINSVSFSPSVEYAPADGLVTFKIGRAHV